MEYNAEERELYLSRELSNLDKFVIDFIRVLERYTDYVLISGYVSILLGRTRVTEDVDIFIKPIPETIFKEFYRKIVSKGFWCLNTDSGAEAFNFLKSGLAIRFAIEGTFAPNFEMKFPKDDLGRDTFSDSIKVILPKEGNLIISCFERHIVFKKYYLMSDKDIADANHIEELFKDKLDYTKINKLKSIIELKKKHGEY